MSLARERCVEVAAAYRLALAIEDLGDGGDPSAQVVSQIDERIEQLKGFAGTAEIYEGVSPLRVVVDEAPLRLHGLDELRHGGAVLFLKKHVAGRVGQRLRDQLDALLILLLVEQAERGWQKLRRAVDLAPWIGVADADIAEIIGARALLGLLHVVPPDNPTQPSAASASVRLTVDGRLLAESLLEADAEPIHAPAMQTSRDRPVAARPRIEGTIERLEIRNVFSFGDEAEPIELGRMNLLIGANGAGKSNILEAIELLASTPRDVQAAIRESGGIYDVLSRRSKPEGLTGAASRPSSASRTGRHPSCTV